MRVRRLMVVGAFGLLLPFVTASNCDDQPSNGVEWDKCQKQSSTCDPDDLRR